MEKSIVININEERRNNMKTQGYINPVVNLSKGLGSSSFNSKSTEISGEFHMVMNQNLASQRKYMDGGFEGKEPAIETARNKQVRDKFEAVEESASKDKVLSKKHSPMDEAKNTSSKTVENGNNPKAKGTISKDELEGIAEEIQTAVMDTLGLTKEELELLLTQLGFTLGNFTDLESLKELVLASAGREDIMEFVTNDDLVQTLQNLVEAVDGVLEKTMMNLSDEEWSQVLDSLDKELLVEDPSLPEEVLIADDEIKQQDKINQENHPSNKLNQESSTHTKVEVVNLSETTNLKQTTDEASDQSNRKDQNQGDIHGTFMENLNQVQVQSRVEYQADGIKIVDVSEIANQILEKIRVVIKPDQTSMEMKLNPDNLGKVNLSVQSKAGQLTAQFVVESEVAKEAIESQLFQLRESLNQQGVKVEAIEVTVASYNFDQDTQTNQGGQSEEKKNHKTQGITLEEAMAMTEETVEDNILAPEMTGTNIDITA